MTRAVELRHKILELVEEYAKEAFPERGFTPGRDAVPVSGMVFGSEELTNLVDASLDFWLTTGRFNDEFELKLAQTMGTRHALTTNSGSSANLVAVSALTSPLLGDRALRSGDEVITCATGFPTTVNPIIQNGLVPVFLDVDIPTYNMDMAALEAAISPRTRAIVLAHTLGNPFDLARVMEVAERHDLFVVEDCCDAFGATYNDQNVGTFGDYATASFYPAHHMTTGEGGAVFTSGPKYKRIARSFRDWGRDCWCDPGADNTCGKRFEHVLGDLPAGYDHKYTFSHLGYNLKMTDMQAAVGLIQLTRLDEFHNIRQRNFDYLTEILSDFEDFLVLPEATENSKPSWFGFPLTLRQDAPFDRNELINYLEENRIATRLLFAGNLIRQPYMMGQDYRVVGDLVQSDMVTGKTFWIGLYPKLNTGHLDYVYDTMSAFVRNFANQDAQASN
jgi:CDP-4-dehydro-6-deoxyglucose reductase, E1